MEKLNKLSLPATIIIASLILGGVYYLTQVNKQKSIEKQQQIEIEQKKQEQSDKEQKEQQIRDDAEQALNSCISDAEKNYATNWHRECKSQGQLTRKCIDIQELDFSAYLDKNGLNPTEYNQQRELSATGKSLDDFMTGFNDYYDRRNDECSCRLPIAYADRFNGDLKDAKNACYELYPKTF